MIGAAKSTSANNDTQEYSERNDLLTSRNGENPSKRVYRVWSSWERYTVCLGIAAYGGIKRDSISKIQSLLEGRTCGQVCILS